MYRDSLPDPAQVTIEHVDGTENDPHESYASHEKPSPVTDADEDCCLPGVHLASALAKMTLQALVDHITQLAWENVSLERSLTDCDAYIALLETELRESAERALAQSEREYPLVPSSAVGLR